jgi:YfiH family protein
VLRIASSRLAELGFAHGFSVRTGGVSGCPYDSLNLGRSVGDDDACVSENHARLAEEIGYAVADLFEVTQVHGAEVVTVTDDDGRRATRGVEADALVTRDPGLALGIRVADCVPVLLADPKSGFVGAAHAGWRGVVAGVLPATVAAMQALGAMPDRLLAVIGPHIRVGHFEVGDEVANALVEVAPGVEEVIDRSGERPHVSLVSVVRAQLEAADVLPARIDDVGGCTYEDAARFYSHRRDRGRTGRHLAVIVAPG